MLVCIALHHTSEYGVSNEELSRLIGWLAPHQARYENREVMFPASLYADAESTAAALTQLHHTGLRDGVREATGVTWIRWGQMGTTGVRQGYPMFTTERGAGQHESDVILSQVPARRMPIQAASYLHLPTWVGN